MVILKKEYEGKINLKHILYLINNLFLPDNGNI